MTEPKSLRLGGHRGHIEGGLTVQKLLDVVSNLDGDPSKVYLYSRPYDENSTLCRDVAYFYKYDCPREGVDTMELIV